VVRLIIGVSEVFINDGFAVLSFGRGRRHPANKLIIGISEVFINDGFAVLIFGHGPIFVRGPRNEVLSRNEASRKVSFFRSGQSGSDLLLLACCLHAWCVRW
jgi:hypothetical protein